MSRFFFTVCAFLISSAAMAQDFGLAAGIHQSTASVDAAAGVGSVSGRLLFDAGLLVSIELVPDVRFRTGFLYDQRQFDYKLSSGAGTIGVNFAYWDIPIDIQYNFTPMFGIFGGMVVGIKGSDSVSYPGGGAYDPGMKSMIPLFNAGVNMIFNDQFGFDVFYEMSSGSFATNMSNWSTYGMHFIYWL